MVGEKTRALCEEIEERVIVFLGLRGRGEVHGSLLLKIANGAPVRYSSEISFPLSRSGETVGSAVVPPGTGPLHQQTPGWSEALELVALTEEWEPCHAAIEFGSLEYVVCHGRTDRIEGNRITKLEERSSA